MTSITEAERVFLSRAEAVTEKKRKRAAHYQQQLQDLMAELQRGDVSNVLDTASVFKAFLERAWHLNPTSQYFPKRYQEIADAVGEAQFDNRLRQRAPYANPYNQLELLNETLKKLAYQFQHCDDPNQLCKLANSLTSQGSRSDARYQRETRTQTSKCNTPCRTTGTQHLNRNRVRSLSQNRTACCIVPGTTRRDLR